MVLVADARAISFSAFEVSFAVDLFSFSFSVDLRSFVASAFAAGWFFGLDTAAAASIEAAARAICSPVERLLPEFDCSLSWRGFFFEPESLSGWVVSLVVVSDDDLVNSEDRVNPDEAALFKSGADLYLLSFKAAASFTGGLGGGTSSACSGSVDGAEGHHQDAGDGAGGEVDGDSAAIAAPFGTPVSWSLLFCASQRFHHDVSSLSQSCNSSMAESS